MCATSKQDGPPKERAAVEHAPEARRSVWERLQQALGGSAWTTLGGKVAAYVAGFFALALVGSGEAMRLLPLGPAETTASMAMVAGGPAPVAATGAAAPETAPAGRKEGAGANAEPPRREGGAGADAGTHRQDATGEAASPKVVPAPHEDGATGAGSETPTGGDGASTPAQAGVTQDGKVVLNLATEADLRRLPGIGPAKAKAILELRAKMKRFRKVEDLLRIKGIGRRSLKRLRPLVVVDPP